MSARGRTIAFALVVGGIIGFVVAVIVLQLFAGTRPAPIAISPPAPTPLPTPPPPPAPLFVHVSGAVLVPGVYEFPPGSRVQEAINAAGGFAPDAFPNQVNLAQVLVDGMMIVVPVVAEEQEALPIFSVPELPPVSGSVQGAGAASGGLVNINTADLVALEELPGIGPALAQRIIDYRIEHGPFLIITEIQDVPGIGPATFADIELLITVNDAP